MVRTFFRDTSARLPTSSSLRERLLRRQHLLQPLRVAFRDSPSCPRPVVGRHRLPVGNGTQATAGSDDNRARISALRVYVHCRGSHGLWNTLQRGRHGLWNTPGDPDRALECSDRWRGRLRDEV
jgi:hypothetical protein